MEGNISWDKKRSRQNVLKDIQTFSLKLDASSGSLREELGGHIATAAITSTCHVNASNLLRNINLQSL